MKIKGIVFDLDGTLIDSMSDMRACINRVLVDMGRQTVTMDELRRMVGRGVKYMWRLILDTTGHVPPEDEVERIIRGYQAYYLCHPTDHTIIYPGVIEALNYFKEENYTLGICTNKPQTLTNCVLNTLDMRDYFSAVVCGDDVRFPKPDGRHLLWTLRTMNTPVAAAIMVGDGKSDIDAAVSAGIPAVCVDYRYEISRVAAMDAHFVIDDLRSLAPAIKRLDTGAFRRRRMA
jgi:phosphoglycolate phosphatase